MFQLWKLTRIVQGRSWETKQNLWDFISLERGAEKQVKRNGCNSKAEILEWETKEPITAARCIEMEE